MKNPKYARNFIFFHFVCEKIRLSVNCLLWYEISHLYSDLVRKPDTDGIMVHCGRCLIEVFTESSGSTYIYRNQFHEVEGKVRGFTTGQYGAQAYGVVGIGFTSTVHILRRSKLHEL